MKRCWLVLLAVCVFLPLGCEKTAHFKVVFIDRLPAEHDIDCFMNGDYLGEVVAGDTHAFDITTRCLDGPTYPDWPKAAYVVFSARDKKTGKISHEFPRAIYTDRTENIEINEWDF